jgi:DNA polymerase-3 subunit delta'
MAHAYVVAGAPRTEGRELAEKTAQLIFCTSKEPPCGKCRGCISAQAHSHPDLFWMEPQSKSRRIVVEDVRQLLQQVSRTGFAGGWKLAVLVGADRLVREAANAFLKTLEEPPPRSLFLLLTDSPQSLLPTVLSRCQMLVLRSAAGELAEPWRSDVVAALADGGDGSVLAAFSRADRVTTVLKAMRAAADAEVRAQAEDESKETEVDGDVLDARASARYRELRAALMGFLLDWYRDVLRFSLDAETALSRTGQERAILLRSASGVDVRRALNQVGVVERMYARMERNLTEGMVLSGGFRELN